MTFGLEEFLRELRAIENIFFVEFKLMEIKHKHQQFLILNLSTKDKSGYQKWLKYSLNSKPTEKHQIKLPKSFASTLKQIKKEIKNQSKDKNEK